MIRKHTFILLLLLGACLSCSREISPFLSTGILKTMAILRWTGDYAVDGCGFFILIGDQEYKPENESVIGDKYKTNDDMTVLIEYRILSERIEFSCGDLPNPLTREAIRIITLKT